MFALTLRQADHVRRYSVVRMGLLGWEIRLEADSKLQRLDHYQDWHRVERVLALFEREASELQESGWRVIDAQPLRQ
jgi:hypothetical protein